MNIKAVGFDYGGVVGVHKSVMPDISSAINLPVDEIRTVYLKYNRLANVEGLSYQEVWKMALDDLGKGEFSDAVNKLLSVNDTIVLNEDVLNLVHELRSKGIRVGLLTNNTSQNGEALRKIGLADHFDSFFVSAEIGYQKPELEAFKVLFDSLGASFGESVYIDDAPSSLRFAGEIGYHPILFTSYDQLRKELISLGVLE